MNERKTSDLPRDEHLRAALRHAPDATLSAPPDLGAQIRAAAWRAAGRAPLPPPPSVATVPQRLWQWFSRPGRMGASGAFATVLVAGVIGLVWRGEVPSPHVDEPPAATAQPSRAAPILADAASVATPAVTTPKAEPVAPAAQRRSPRTEERVAAAPAAAPPPADPGPARSREENTDTADARPAAPPAAPPAAAPAMRSSPALESPRAFSKAADAAASADFGSWLEAARSRADASPLLTALAASTQGRWVPAAVPPPDWPVVELPRHGRTAATLAVGDDSAWGCLVGPEPRCQRAPLTPEQAARLRELMTAAAPRR